MTDFFEAAFDEPMTRRRLIKGIAATGAATWAANSLTGQALAAAQAHIVKNDFAHFRALAPSAADALQVPDGYAADVVIAWGDEFAPGMKFGYNCDYYPLEGKSNEGLLWVNHEYLVPFFTSDWDRSQDASWNPRTTHRDLMEREKSEVGGSIVHVRRGSNGKWNVLEGSRYARRFTAAGPAIPYTGPSPAPASHPPEDRFSGRSQTAPARARRGAPFCRARRTIRASG